MSDTECLSVAIVGASRQRRKFGNKAVRAYALRGYRVFPINLHESTIEGHPVFPSIADVPVPRLDRVSIYLPPEKCLEILADLVRKPVGEVWFNPGSESPEVLFRALNQGLNIIQGCSILDIGVDPWDLVA